jgi:CRP-like cAMP-binding protein
MPRIMIINEGEIDLLFEEKEDRLRLAKEPNVIKSFKKGDILGQYEFFTHNYEAVFTVRSVGLTSVYYFDLVDFLEIL